MSSIMSFPNRGKWGDPLWRGNCSGYVYEALFKQLKPKVFVDPMQGSGTSIEVATEMQIECYGLDLYSGFNAVRDSILGAVGKEADCCISHPPYGSMILYSGAVWGKPHPDDLSRCVSDSDFNEKMQLVLLNQRAATTDGGFYGTIIGDRRQEGRYTSYMAEMIARMPKDELASVIIKAQHNCQSDNKSYGRMKLPRRSARIHHPLAETKNASSGPSRTPRKPAIFETARNMAKYRQVGSRVFGWHGRSGENL